ncbi:hypothetical protein [Lacipirellula parvula]|uniref:Uncharacterized protein n=1 Tax=Lacipirellula parvula TaxID=2650471 RepID=A0A5K7XDT6_9BACT|nr:hypothetical protein [Lacipirellula parvula]BBO34217.1 hypothetical protein PLANPX_3829 [Lacipirellula parvula]
MIYNQTFVKTIHLEKPVFIEQITGVEYPSRAAAEAACHAIMFDLNCSIPGDATTHVRVTRTLAAWQELCQLRMAQA